MNIDFHGSLYREKLNGVEYDGDPDVTQFNDSNNDIPYNHGNNGSFCNACSLQP